MTSRQVGLWAFRSYSLQSSRHRPSTTLPSFFTVPFISLPLTSVTPSPTPATGEEGDSDAEAAPRRPAPAKKPAPARARPTPTSSVLSGAPAASGASLAGDSAAGSKRSGLGKAAAARAAAARPVPAPKPAFPSLPAAPRPVVVEEEEMSLMARMAARMGDLSVVSEVTGAAAAASTGGAAPGPRAAPPASKRGQGSALAPARAPSASVVVVEDGEFGASSGDEEVNSPAPRKQAPPARRAGGAASNLGAKRKPGPAAARKLAVPEAEEAPSPVVKPKVRVCVIGYCVSGVEPGGHAEWEGMRLMSR